ncbi:MAG: multidrug transporter [Acidobacteria bacterium CG_4_9_14_3_um_filter_49_7]|nr:MAG: multidrug transporter [Acidobacteria bacterium CG_4_9_14_3_um_filter_49_7]
MKRKIFELLGITFLLVGCTMSPKYTRPAAPIPEQLPKSVASDTTNALATSPMPADIGWQQFFPDKKLQGIIQLALDNNRDLRLAGLNMEKARALYGIQRAELLPSINAVGTGTHARTSSDLLRTGEPQRTEQYSVNLGITSWELDFFGRVRSLKNQALQQYLSTEYARRSAQIALVAEVARTYLTLASDQENLKLAQSTYETQRDAHELIQKSYEAGVVSELDLERAQTQVDAARGNMARYTQLVSLDRNALELLLGSQVPEELLPVSLDNIEPPLPISPGLSSEVLLQRPDILMAESLLKGENAAIGAARATLFPRISLTTAIGTASRKLSGLFKSGNNTWNFTPQVALPIFDPRTWSALKVSKANRKIALAQYEKAIQSAFREVADALAVKRTVDQQVSAQQSIVNSTRNIYKLSNARYKQGIDSYLDVLDAQRSLYAAQQRLISLRLAKLANRVRLYAVLGGGDKAENGPKDSPSKGK